MARALLKWDIEDVFPGERYVSTDYIDEDIYEEIQALVYPNPANETVYFAINADVKNMQVYLLDIQGKLLQKEQVFTNFTQLDISNLPAGMYYVKIIVNSEAIINKKLCIVK